MEQHKFRRNCNVGHVNDVDSGVFAPLQNLLNGFWDLLSFTPGVCLERYTRWAEKMCFSGWNCDEVSMITSILEFITNLWAILVILATPAETIKCSILSKTEDVPKPI